MAAIAKSASPFKYLFFLGAITYLFIVSCTDVDYRGELDRAAITVCFISSRIFSKVSHASVTLASYPPGLMLESISVSVRSELTHQCAYNLCRNSPPLSRRRPVGFSLPRPAGEVSYFNFRQRHPTWSRERLASSTEYLEAQLISALSPVNVISPATPLSRSSTVAYLACGDRLELLAALGKPSLVPLNNFDQMVPARRPAFDRRRLFQPNESPRRANLARPLEEGPEPEGTDLQEHAPAPKASVCSHVSSTRYSPLFV